MQLAVCMVTPAQRAEAAVLHPQPEQGCLACMLCLTVPAGPCQLSCMRRPSISHVLQVGGLAQLLWRCGFLLGQRVSKM